MLTVFLLHEEFEIIVLTFSPHRVDTKLRVVATPGAFILTIFFYCQLCL